MAIIFGSRVDRLETSLGNLPDGVTISSRLLAKWPSVKAVAYECRLLPERAILPTHNFASLHRSNKHGQTYLAYDSLVPEFAMWRLPMVGYDGNKLSICIEWKSSYAVSGEVHWNLELIQATPKANVTMAGKTITSQPNETHSDDPVFRYVTTSFTWDRLLVIPDADFWLKISRFTEDALLGDALLGDALLGDALLTAIVVKYGLAEAI